MTKLNQLFLSFLLFREFSGVKRNEFPETLGNCFGKSTLLLCVPFPNQLKGFVFILLLLSFSIFLNFPADAHIQTSSNGKMILDNNGKAYLQGNWTNNGVFTPNTGTIIFEGTTQDTIFSADTFYNLTIDKSGSGSVQLNSDITVSNNLALIEGSLLNYDGSRALRGGESKNMPVLDVY